MNESSSEYFCEIIYSKEITLKKLKEAALEDEDVINKLGRMNEVHSHHNCTLYIIHCPSKLGQAKKSIGRMPWHQEPKKDVTSCEKLRRGANNH